jgi:uncharacterized protein
MRFFAFLPIRANAAASRAVLSPGTASLADHCPLAPDHCLYHSARISRMLTKPRLIVLSVLAFSFASLAIARQQAASPGSDYSSRAQTVVNEITSRQFDKVFAQFDTTMASAFSVDKLSQVWDQVLSQAGAFRKIDSTEVIDQSGYHVATTTCTFANAPVNIILAFDSAGRIAGLRFTPAENAPAAQNSQPSSSASAQNSQAAAPAAPSWSAPAYADPSKFHEVALTIADGQWQLPGTLTLPNGNGPFTAVLLVSGSGPNDADESIGPNKVFKDIAWGLATNGVAVLRYAKRTHEYGMKSSADMQNFTVKDEYLDDAHAAVTLLASRPEIDSHRIFLAGHSEGGYLAPRIAAANPQIAGLIILEGSTRPLEQLIIEQLKYQASLGGPNAPQIEKMIPEAEAQAQAIEDPNLKPGVMLPVLTTQIPSSYFLDLRSYDPCAVAASLKIPIYVTQGGRDYQVTTTDFANWQKALAGHSNATLKLYPSLNHLLISGTGLSNPEEYFAPGQHVSPEIISDLSSWLHSH